MSSFLSASEIEKIGLKSVGKDVLISRYASFYGESDIVIGNNVRIDDFCILSGKIQIGNYVHIAAYDALYGGNCGIYIGNYSTISSHTSVYSVSDDYSGKTMTNPMIPDEFKNVTSKEVIIGENTIVGSHSVILPGSIVSEGCAVGAMSLIRDTLETWKIYAGIPCRIVKERDKNVKKMQLEFENQRNSFIE